MKQASIEVFFHGGEKVWYLNILHSDTAQYTELIITDEQAQELKDAGVPDNSN